MGKRALIIGVSGQDGAYLSHLLLSKGYELHGTSRDKDRADLSRLDLLNVRARVKLHSANIFDYIIII